MNTLRVQLRVNSLNQALELATTICDRYFGADAKYHINTQATLTEENAASGVFIVEVWAEVEDFTMVLNDTE